MKRFASYITALASLTAIFTVVQFESLTGLSSRWERPENRLLLEQRMQLTHTNLVTKEFSESGYKSNMNAVQSYSDAYLCQSGKDKNRCLVSGAAALAH